MLALSLWQPWASALFATRTVLGDAVRPKVNETRSWSTSYRGPVLICAAHRWDADLRAIAERDLAEVLSEWVDPFGDAIKEPQHTDSRWATVSLATATCWQLPLGAALGLVDIIDCVSTESLHGRVPEWEWAMGNYEPGRYALVTANPRPLRNPLPIRARQKLFRPDDAMRAAVLAQLDASKAGG